LTEFIVVGAGTPIIQYPDEFMLGSTTVCVAISNDIVGNLDGRGSLGRLGLVVL
jgi:deoxycytidine triphosphate deaminase